MALTLLQLFKIFPQATPVFRRLKDSGVTIASMQKRKAKKCTNNFKTFKDGMRRLSKSHKFVALIYAIAAGVFAADEAIGERAYLPSIGSPPLRIQVLNTNHLYLSLKSFAPAAVSDVVTNLAAFATNASNEAVSSISSTNANQAGISQQAGSDAKTNSESVVVSPNISSSEAGLPTVTPEMISEYLKPDRTQTDQAHHRGTVEFVPVEMQFAPSFPKSSGESRATYKTQ